MDDSPPCPGVCNTTWRRTSEGEPHPGDPVWCAMDTARIRRLLGELDDLAALLHYQVNGHREQPHQPGRQASHTPSPSPATDDLDELERVLLAWEDAYRELPRPGFPSGWPSPPRRGNLATVVTTAVAWLVTHLDGILASPLAEDFGAEIAQWHREFTAKTRAGGERRRKPIPCPRCGLKLLSWAEGDDHVVCGGCNRHMTVAEYHEELAAHARQLERAS